MYGVLGSVIFMVADLLASVSAKLVSSHLRLAPEIMGRGSKEQWMILQFLTDLLFG